MARLEDELRISMSRKEPGAHFTAAVMRRVRESGASPAEVVEFRVERANPLTRLIPGRRWAIVGAVAAALAVGVFVGQRHNQQAKRHLAEMQAAEAREAQQAGQELMLSLQLAGVKVNKARDAVLRTVGTHTGGESQ